MEISLVVFGFLAIAFAISAAAVAVVSLTP